MTNKLIPAALLLAAVASVQAQVSGFNIGVNYSRNSDLSAGASEFFVNREILKNTYGYFDVGRADKALTDGIKNANAYALGVIYVF